LNETTTPAPVLRSLPLDKWGALHCYPKHMDVEVRTSTIPWQLLKGQTLGIP
jgi:hypothetical protein